MTNDYDINQGPPTRVCGYCGETKPWIDSRRRQGLMKRTVIYVDDRGSRWSSRRCPECRKVKDVQRSRRLGIHKAIDEVTSHNQAMARRDEMRVAAMLLRWGYRDIEMTKMQGPDIVFTDELGVRRTCEVKSMCLDPNSRRSWFTTPVMPKRRGDDFIAIVFPNGDIRFSSMVLHHRATAPCGRRTFTQEILDEQLADAAALASFA